MIAASRTSALLFEFLAASRRPLVALALGMFPNEVMQANRLAVGMAESFAMLMMVSR